MTEIELQDGLQRLFKQSDGFKYSYTQQTDYSVVLKNAIATYQIIKQISDLHQNKKKS